MKGDMNFASADRSKSNLLEPKWQPIAILLIAAALLVSVFKLWDPYSYWIDEAFSVDSSIDSIDVLYQHLLDDVHPPLYQIILKLWIGIFGAGEPATRTLSWLFGIASIYPLFRFSRRYGQVFSTTALLVFCTATPFIFNSNETRPYAMTLFMCVLAVTNFPYAAASSVTYKFLASCVLLSLSHYFGLIFVGVMLGLCFFQNLKNVPSLVKISLTGLVCLVWPIHHILVGSVLKKTGGEFWIEVGGFAESFAIAASGFLPKTGRGGGYALVVGLAAAILFAVHSRTKRDASPVVSVALNTSLMALSFMLLIAIFDLHTPMSTGRNYIVLLPPVAFALASIVVILSDKFPALRGALMTAVLCYCVLLLIFSYRSIVWKASAVQDWKNATRVSMAAAAQGRDVYFIGHGGTVHYYLRLYGGPAASAIDYIPGATKVTRAAVLIYGNIGQKEFEQLSLDMKLLNAQRIFPAEKAPGDGYPAGAYLIN